MRNDRTGTVEKPEYAHVGESRGAENHDHDMIRELGRRLEFLWHCDQYIANSDGDSQLQTLWRDLKRQEQANIQRMKQMIVEHVKKDCF